MVNEKKPSQSPFGNSRKRKAVLTLIFTDEVAVFSPTALDCDEDDDDDDDDMIDSTSRNDENLVITFT